MDAGGRTHAGTPKDIEKNAWMDWTVPAAGSEEKLAAEGGTCAALLA